MEKKDTLLPMTIDFDDPKMIATLKATVAQGLNDHEFGLFAQHCKATGLNPFKREVWAIKGQGYTNKQGKWVEGRLQIMTGINGFWTTANKHPMYDGCEKGWLDAKGEMVKVCLGDCAGAWIRVYRKDRKIPEESIVYMDEYYKDEGRWKAAKKQMILKCAESVGLRKAFPQELNSMYTEEEMPGDFSRPEPLNVTPVKTDPAKLPGVIAADELPWDNKAQKQAGEEPQTPPDCTYYGLADYAQKHSDQWPTVRELLERQGCECMDAEKQIWCCPKQVAKFDKLNLRIDPLDLLDKEAA